MSKLLFLLPLMLLGCVSTTPPVAEYVLARTAIESAKTVDAARFSTGYFHKAELAYKKGQQHFEDREYGRAESEFRKARDAAEKAENSARLIRFKNGEVL